MKNWALILHEKVWQIVQSETEPNWPPMEQPGDDGKLAMVPSVFVEVADADVKQGWGYDGAGGFSPPVAAVETVSLDEANATE